VLVWRQMLQRIYGAHSIRRYAHRRTKPSGAGADRPVRALLPRRRWVDREQLLHRHRAQAAQADRPQDLR